MSLRGSYKARVDDRSRLKVPAEFRRVMQDTWGSELFVTSFNGRDVLVFPLAVWEQELERRLLSLPPTDPGRRAIQKIVNYFGQSQSMDSQGRVVMPSPLKEKAGVTGEVFIFGSGNHLTVQEAGAAAADVEDAIRALEESQSQEDLGDLSRLWRTQE